MNETYTLNPTLYTLTPDTSTPKRPTSPKSPKNLPILQVTKEASENEITKAYRRLAVGLSLPTSGEALRVTFEAPMVRNIIPFKVP